MLLINLHPHRYQRRGHAEPTPDVPEPTSSTADATRTTKPTALSRSPLA